MTEQSDKTTLFKIIIAKVDLSANTDKLRVL